MARKIGSSSSRFHSQATRDSTQEPVSRDPAARQTTPVDAALRAQPDLADVQTLSQIKEKPVRNTVLGAGDPGAAKIVERAISTRSVLTPGIANTAGNGSLQRSGSPGRFVGAPVREETGTALASVPAYFRSRSNEFTYDYGLYTIQPEILSLYDLDSLFDPSGEVKEMAEFLSIQRAAAKITQEAGYRAVRQTLSNLPARQEEPSAETRRILIPSGPFEESNATLFEQVVAAWDRDAAIAIQTIDSNEARAIRMQNLLSLMDISNLPLTKGGRFIGIWDVIYAASQSPAFRDLSRPIAVWNSTVPRHRTRDFTSVDVDSTVPFVFDLMGLSASRFPQIANAKRLDGAFSSYTLMYWLLQSAHAFFVFGSSGATPAYTESYTGSGITQVRAFAIGDDPAAKTLKNEAFNRPENFSSDMRQARSSRTSAESAAVIMHNLAVVAAARASEDDVTNSRSLDESLSSILGTTLFAGQNGTGARSLPTHSLDAALKGSVGTAVRSLFDIPTAEGRAVFFDRFGAGSLPEGFVSGYPRIFGSGDDAAQVAADLSNRVTSAAAEIRRVQRLVPTVDIPTSRGSTKVSDIPTLILREITPLLKIDYSTTTQQLNELGGVGEDDETIAGLYGNFVSVAGTNSTPQLGSTLGETYASGQPKFFTVSAGIDLPIFMTMSEAYGSTLRNRVSSMIDEIMRYWSQSYDFKTGAREDAPDPITTSIYGRNPQDVHDVFMQLQRYYKRSYTRTDSDDDPTYQNFIGIHFHLNTTGAALIDRLVDWCINVAKIILPGVTSDEQIVTSCRGTPHSLKSISLNIFAMLCFTLDACFTRDFNVKSDWDGGSVGRPVHIFKQSGLAFETLMSLSSSVGVTMSDGHLALEIVASQLERIAAHLADFSSQEQPTDPEFASPLVGGVFNQACTPVQNYAARLRYSSYLSRAISDPYHSWRYDASSVLPVKKATAARALLSHPYFHDDNVKVLLVGLPAGIAHIAGQEEKYVKVVISLVSKDLGQEPIEITRYFSFNTFFSPERAYEIGLSPVETDAGSRSVTAPIFALGETDPVLHTTSFDVLNDDVTPMGESGRVRVTDYTITCTFLSLSGLAKELSVPSIAAIDVSKLRDNHVIDGLLKEHIREVSGLDLDESVFTTSETAFNPRVPDNMDTLRVKAYGQTSQSVITPERAKNPQALSADLRILDVFSRTPIIRSNTYADLCIKPTIFDRVFAIPVRVWSV